MVSGQGRLRIGVVHYSDYALDSRLQRQARALAQEGHEIDAVGVSTPSEQQVGPGIIRLHGVGCAKVRGGVGSYLRGYGSFFARALGRLSVLDHRRRFDLVEVHNMPDFLTFAALWPKLRGTPVVLDVMDTFPELFATKFGVSLSHPLGRVLVAEERASAALADAVIVVTGEAGDRLNSRGTGAGRTHVVMNSPDERVFGSARPPVQRGPEEPLRMVYHGGTAPRYGVESLVRALGLLSDGHPDVRLDVLGLFGDGAVADVARQLAPDRVRVWPEPVPFERIPVALEGFHAGVVPTLHDDFTELLLPVKLMEYVHMGMPVVASRLPVICRYFSDDEVLYYEPGSPESLAAALRNLHARPQEAHERAERASHRLEGLRWGAQRKRYLALIEGLARDGARRAGPAGARMHSA